MVPEWQARRGSAIRRRRDGVLYERAWTWLEVAEYFLVGTGFVVANAWLIHQIWR